MKRIILTIALLHAITMLISCKGTVDPKTSTVNDSAAVSSDWQLAVQLWTFHKFDFVTAIEKADSAGIRFIEAFPGQKMGGDFKDSVFDGSLSPESRAKVKDMLKSKGMTIVAYGVVVPQTPEAWVDIFSFAGDMGIRYITAEPLRSHWSFIDSLAGVHNIKVAIHDHPKPSAYWHPDSVLAAIAGRPNIGACADIGHWGRNGLDPVECLKKLEGHIVGLHLKDIKEMGKVDAADMIPGTGVINIPAVLAELKRQGFKGTFSIEHEDNWYNNVPDVKQIVGYFNAEVAALK